jgi:hypothetical protein
VWVDGEWSMHRGRWSWVRGRWIVVPKGVSYSPWAFVRAPDGALGYAPGAFWDADGKRVAPPEAIVEAKAGTVGIVDPDGTTDTTGRTRRAPAGLAKVVALVDGGVALGDAAVVKRVEARMGDAGGAAAFVGDAGGSVGSEPVR